MDKGIVSVFYGEGEGKTTAAIGKAVRAASQGKTVIIIQFLKGKKKEESSFIKNMEPAIRWFTFEKADLFFEHLTEEQKKEEALNIQNGLNFAKKVLAIHEADVLVLDEVLGLLDNKLVRVEDIRNLVDALGDHTELILTGRALPSGILELADKVSKIEKVK